MEVGLDIQAGVAAIVLVIEFRASDKIFSPNYAYIYKIESS